MSWKILVSAPYMQPVIGQYRKMLDESGVQIELVIPPVQERLSQAELLRWINEIDGVICGDDEFTEDVMKAAPNLKVISKWGTGIDSIDQEAASRLGITVCNTTDAFTHPVADSVLGYMLSFSRQLPWMDREIKAGRWVKSSGFSLRESTLGVIGVGNVGRAVIRRAISFGTRVIGHDTAEVSPSFLHETGVEMVGKEELLSQSDFVTLNCDLNSSTRYIIGVAELEIMKKTAYLINTARGPLINEQALVVALQNRQIAGAALDVFEIEPLPDDSKLRNLENCLLAPHNANSSPEAYLKVHENTIKNLLQVLQHS